MKYQAMLMLIVAIAFELLGTTSLKLTEGGARPMWYIPVTLGYAAAFYCFSLALKEIPLGISYAIWAGVGIVGTAVIGKFLFQQSLSQTALAGIGLILLGAVLVNFNSPAAH
jgi:small multidrug resistance pump